MKKLFVFVGTYSSGNSDSEGIYVYRFDLSNGSVSYVGTTIGIDNPSYLKVSPDGRFLYVVSEVFEVKGIPGGLAESYSIDQKTGVLTYLNSKSTRGACPCHLNIDRTGQHVFVSNYMGGSIAVLPVQEDGTLGSATDIVQHEGSSNINPERQEGPHPHSITISPDNRFAIAADLGKDMLLIYKLDIVNGKLLPGNDERVKTEPGGGPRHMDFHPNGRYIFLLNELGNTIESYQYNDETGALKLIGMISTLPHEFDGESIAADIHIHPEGKFLYASNRGHDSIVICNIDTDSGTLEVLGHQSTKGAHPRNFSIDPTGEFLLVANRDTNDIVTFKIDRETGLLSPIGQVIRVPQPVCISFLSAAPNGK